jgi:hypothetical protein
MIGLGMCLFLGVPGAIHLRPDRFGADDESFLRHDLEHLENGGCSSGLRAVDDGMNFANCSASALPQCSQNRQLQPGRTNGLFGHERYLTKNFVDGNEGTEGTVPSVPKTLNQEVVQK